MKKIISFALAAVMALSMVACGGGEEAKSYDVAAVAKTIEDANPIRMSTPIAQDYIDFIGLSEDMYEAYAGSYCPITPGVDVIMVVEAKDGKVEDVKAKLEQRKAEIVAANENYVGSLLDKAKEGRIVVKGNVVVLVIAGDEMVVEDQGVAKAYEPVDAAIEEAFK
ncbi:MAG: DUF4358 domain-containing protein [Oscillospiraceae bacterium]|nr:DUF4358 domain-containing protein [Oscillospiraceae bacterium]